MNTTKRIILGLLLVFLVLITILMVAVKVHVRDIEYVEGSGNKVSEMRQLDSFTGIEASGNVEVTLFQEGRHAVQITTDDNLIGLVVTEVKNNTLKIYYQQFGKTRDKIYLDVYLDELESLSVNAGARLKSSGVLSGMKLDHQVNAGAFSEIEIDYSHLDLRVTSGAHATLSGQADMAVISSNAGAQIKAGSLMVREADVRGNSGSITNLHISDRFSARMSSGAQLNYTGNPSEKDTSTSSGGSVNQR